MPRAVPAEDTERVEGLLQEVDCRGGTAILHVAVGGETVLLRVADPAEVKVVEQGEEKGSLTLACGRQPGHAVSLAYVAARDAPDGIVGDVVLLEVR